MDFECLLLDDDLDSEPRFFLAGDSDVDNCLNFDELVFVILDGFVPVSLMLSGEDALDWSDPSISEEPFLCD